MSSEGNILCVSSSPCIVVTYHYSKYQLFNDIVLDFISFLTCVHLLNCVQLLQIQVSCTNLPHEAITSGV